MSKVKVSILYKICKILFILILLFKYSLHIYAQKNELNFKSINFENFPKVKADIWVRDPEGIDTSQLFIFEEGKQVKMKYLGKKDSASGTNNKSILFLVLNPGSSNYKDYFELDWYKKVLSDAINSGTIQKGDKIDILNFNHQFSGQILFPSSIDYTDDINVLNQRINGLSNRVSSPRSCSNKGSLVLPAIDRALDLIQSQNLSMPSGIVVLSDDVVCPSNQVEGLTEKAKRRNIPIYSIVYSGIRPPFNSIDTFCLKTYGQYFRDSDLRFSPSRSSAELVQYLASFLSRHRGIIYRYEWTTQLPKDGSEHRLLVKYRDLSTESLHKTPRQSFIEWCKANPILSGGSVLILLGIASAIYFFYQDQKKKKHREEQKFLELSKRQKDEAEQLSSQLQAQKSELDLLKSRERAEKQRLEEKHLQELNSKREKELMRLMKLIGSVPRIDCIVSGKSFVFNITKPEVLIGRSSECDLCLNYPTVSKKHCKINFTGDRFLLEDLGSSNGTILNSKGVQQSVIKNGDVVRLGEVVLNFRV